MKRVYTDMNHVVAILVCVIWNQLCYGESLATGSHPKCMYVYIQLAIYIDIYIYTAELL